MLPCCQRPRQQSSKEKPKEQTIEQSWKSHSLKFSIHALGPYKHVKQQQVLKDDAQHFALNLFQRNVQLDRRRDRDVLTLSIFVLSPSVAKCQSRPRKFIRRGMKRMRRPLMQISGDNSRRIDYSEGREIHSGWAQECDRGRDCCEFAVGTGCFSSVVL